MSYLAYDPDRVDALVRTMQRSLDEVRRVRCDDPAAAGATSALRALTLDVETVWLPLARHTVASTSLTAGHRQPSDLGELPNSLAFVMVSAYGWSLVDDPLRDDTRVVTTEEARALGARMNRADGAATAGDAQELHWLASQLEVIARDPRLAAEFLANFHEWAPWGDALGRQRARLLAGIEHDVQVTVADLDTVFAGLAHVQRAVLPDHSSGAAPAQLPWLDEMHPYAAAATVRHLGLSGVALAEVADRLLQRDPLTEFDALPGPNTADLLLPLLAADAIAMQQFLLRAAHHPEVVLERTADTAAAYRLILDATDPSRMSVDVAGQIVPSFVSYFASTEVGCDEQCYVGAVPPDDHRAFLVDLVSPWMLQFSPQNHQWEFAVWQRDHLLSFVLDDDASLRRFIDHADRVQQGFITSLSSGTNHRLEELGAFMAMIGGLIVSDRVQEKTERGRAREMLATLAGLVTIALPGVAVSLAIALGIAIVNQNGSPDPITERHRVGLGADLAVTTAGAAIAAQITDQWKASGRVPADFPMPPIAHPGAELPSQDFMIEFVEWRNTLPGGEFGRLADRISRMVFAVINPGMMGEHSVTLFMP